MDSLDTSHHIHGLTILSTRFDHDIIFLETKDATICLKAMAECCSMSWFQLVDHELDSLVGKTLDKVEYGQYTEENDGESKTREIVLKLINGDNFTFLLHNSSNGYYNGYLETTIIPTKTKLT